MGRDGAQRVMDNLNTRIWFRLTDDKTAKLATEGLGFTNVEFEEAGHSLSVGGIGGLVGSTSARLSRADKPLIRPEWLTAMPRGECLVRLRGENWKLRVPLLTPVGKDERRAVAERYGLGEVLAELQGSKRPADRAASEEPQQAETTSPATTEAGLTRVPQAAGEPVETGASWLEG